MKQLRRLRHLNQSGVHHILVPALVFVLLFGITGSYFLLKSHAAAAGYDFQLGYDRTLCLDNSRNGSSIRNPILQWYCNSKDAAQQFSLQSVGSNRFLIKDSRGTCVDDPGGRVGTASSPARLMTWACNKYDHAQVWMWSGSGGYHELKNAYNNGCINDPGYSRSVGKQMIVYACVNTSNEHWYQVAASVAPSPAPVPAPVPAPTPTPTPTPPPSSGGSTTAATCPSPKPTAPVTGYTVAACEDFNNGLGAFGPYNGGGSGTVVGVGRTPSQCTVTGGMLELKQAANGATCGGWMNNFDQQYGYWEVKMRAYSTGSSSGSAPHPVLILWPGNGQWTSELDFFETNIGSSAGGFLHCNSNPSQNCFVLPSNSVDFSQWHVYGIQLTPTSMTGYIDGTKWWSSSNISSFKPLADSNLTIQLDNLSGSTPVKPAEMDIDWAHMYK